MNETNNLNIYTVGYEGVTPEALVTCLVKNRIQVLVDARYRPQSRKAGFSKNSLEAHLKSGDILYQHERDLGTPPDIMAVVRNSGGYEDFDKYRAFLLTKVETLERVAALASLKVICIMCYEADHSECHRSIVAEEIAKLSKGRVYHLRVE